MCVDADNFCNSCATIQLFQVGDILDGFLVTQNAAGKVVLEKILTQQPD